MEKGPETYGRNRYRCFILLSTINAKTRKRKRHMMGGSTDYRHLLQISYGGSRHIATNCAVNIGYSVGLIIIHYSLFIRLLQSEFFPECFLFQCSVSSLLF
jgi:hypothetical protein